MARLLKRIPLWAQILCALGLAIGVGSVFGESASIGGLKLLEVYSFVGDLFLRGLKMLIVPLIASAIVTGVAGLGADRSFGRLGLKTIAYYISTSTLAILTGLLLVNTIKPGLANGKPIDFGLKATTAEVKARVGDKDAGDVVEVLKRAIPENIVSTGANNGDMLALIVFSIIFGYALSKVPGEAGATLMRFWQGVYEVMLRITDVVMRFAPLGVFALVAKVVVMTDWDQLLKLFNFFITALGGLLIHTFITLPLLLLLFGRIKPWRHFRAMFPSMITAFSTSSSSATLPVTMDCLEKNAKVSNRITSFVVPLGATVNMNGTALYECVAAMFIAQVYGLELSFKVQFITVLLALLTSIGVAGVPSASLVAIVVILNAIHLPIEGLGLIMVFDRILDMFRTTVNVFGDTCGAVIIARSEGETTVLAGEG